jgi:subtilisin family serine protease
MTNRLLVTLFLIAVSTSAAFSQTGPRRRVAYAPPVSSASKNTKDSPRKLSKSLADIADHDVTLVGQALDGSLVVEGRVKELADLGNVVEIQSTNALLDQSNQLILSYPAGRQPTAAALRAMGLQSVEENKAAEYLVVAPIREDVNGVNRSPGVRPSVMRALEDSPDVLKISRNAVMSIPDIELNPKRISRSELELSTASANPELDRVEGISRTGAPTVRHFTEKSEVIVAVIDTGVEFDHHDLTENMWINIKERDGQPGVDDDNNGVPDDVHGASFLNGRVSGDPRDDNGHGTHCAGTIAAVANGQGVVGMAQAKIMALKFLNRTGGGGRISDAIRCIDYARENGARIISNSWGGIGDVPFALEQAIERAQREGILFVVAAGNNGLNIDSTSFSPANSRNDNVLTVGAINFAGQRSGFSNFGPRNVDIGAPGGTGNPPDADDIFSTYLNDGFAFLPGTSMATPHVSGAAALLLASPEFRNRPDKTVIDLKQALVNNAKRNTRLNGAWLNNNELDVSFLQSDTRPPESRVPEKTFFYSQAKVFTENATLITRKIRLDTPASVTLFAGASASGVSGQQTFSTGIRIGDTDHKPSFRLVTSGGSDDYVSFGTTLTTQLEAGVHDVSWWIRLPKNGRLAVRGGGSLDVQAFAKN